jgi:hypothetical protein
LLTEFVVTEFVVTEFVVTEFEYIIRITFAYLNGTYSDPVQMILNLQLLSWASPMTVFSSKSWSSGKGSSVNAIKSVKGGALQYIQNKNRIEK